MVSLLPTRAPSADDLRPPADRPQEKARVEPGAAGIPRLARRDGPLPLSFAQERLWFLDRLAPGAACPCVAGAVRIEGALAVPILAACLSSLAARHEALRTLFGDSMGRPFQRVLAPSPVELAEVDLAALPPRTRERELARLATSHGERAFDLAAGPLFRTLLLATGDRDRVLVWAFHPIVADAASAEIFRRELATLYPVFAAGQPSPLAPLALDYADFAAWQRSRLAGDTLAAEVAFWRGLLAGAAPVLELAADRPRPPVRRAAGGARPLALPAALARQVRQVAREEGATPFLVLLTGLAALLSRLSREERFAIGSPVAGRGPETEGLIGPFADTLPLPADLTGNPSFGEALARLRRATLAARSRPHVPFACLAGALAPERSLAHSPLFQVVFALAGPAVERLELSGLTFTPCAVARRTVPFDLAVSLLEADGEGGLAGEIEYRADLFDAVSVDRLGGHFVALLSRALAEPGRPLLDFPVTSDAERWQAVGEWNAVGSTPPLELAPVLVRGWVERAPEALAILHDGGGETYGQLWQRATRLARHLVARGVGPEVPVAVCLPRSPNGIAAFLGVLLAGGAFVALDPDAPGQRLAFQLADSGSRLWVARRALLEKAGDGVALPLGGLVDFDEVMGDRGAEGAAGAVSDGASLPLLAPQSLAYVVYTSGSTGAPRGVGVSHGALAAHLAAARLALGLAPGERALQFAAWSFDAAVEQILAPLSAGATLVLRGEELWGLEELLPRLAAQRVTVADLPTAYWQQWVETRAGDAPPEGLALRLVTPGGEALQLSSAARWAASPLGAVRLVNGYGPTEAVVTAAYFPVPAVLSGSPATAPIGRPLPGRTFHVLDPGGHPQPIGAPGELLLGGILARGYLGASELTARSFVPDPYGEAGARLYRTGDLARRLPDGTIEFLGRSDRQVKVRGFRIELEEIEAALLGHPAVAEAAVVAAGGRLAAYVAPTGVTAEALKAHLRERLPEPMVPALWVALPELPKTATGKLDRRALPPPVFGTARGLAPPATPLEEVLAGIWCELLGVARVGREDDFFGLGGHSLLTVELVSRLAAMLAVELPVRSIFAAPTLAGWAAEVGRELALAGDDILEDLLDARMEGVR